MEIFGDLVIFYKIHKLLSYYQMVLNGTSCLLSIIFVKSLMEQKA